jgi:hypothetical protein
MYRVIQTWIDFNVEADPALLELAYAVRIAEKRHPTMIMILINDI